eukprot:2807560-Alexandrium_andersonii.AAC.1
MPPAPSSFPHKCRKGRPCGQSRPSGGPPRQRHATPWGGARPTRLCRADVPTPWPPPPGP